MNIKLIIVFYMVLFTANLSGSQSEKLASLKSCVTNCLVDNDDPLSLLFLRNFVSKIIRDAWQAEIDRQTCCSDSGIDDWQIVND
jgi:hypothetical protein